MRFRTIYCRISAGVGRIAVGDGATPRCPGWRDRRLATPGTTSDYFLPFFLPFLSFFDFFAMVTPPPYGVERCAFLASDLAGTGWVTHVERSSVESRRTRRLRDQRRSTTSASRKSKDMSAQSMSAAVAVVQPGASRSSVASHSARR